MRSKEAELSPGTPKIAGDSGEVASRAHKSQEWRGGSGEEDPAAVEWGPQRWRLQSKPFWEKFSSCFLTQKRNCLPDPSNTIIVFSNLGYFNS